MAPGPRQQGDHAGVREQRQRRGGRAASAAAAGVRASGLPGPPPAGRTSAAGGDLRMSATAARAELTDGETQVRHELGLLYSDVALEIRRRTRPVRGAGIPRRMPVPGFLKELQKEAPTLALQYVGQ